MACTWMLKVICSSFLTSAHRALDTPFRLALPTTLYDCPHCLTLRSYLMTGDWIRHMHILVVAFYQSMHGSEERS
ncbi:hypothetical protein BD769DRAFT_1468385 [Suillus cothurnatus]|nr:hypothetical protein BD769DRAFT_1468385 [Suillus cothurnatus]